MTEQEHLLTITSEECVETSQRCSKAIRFGMDEIEPGQELRNDERILVEFNDLVGALEMLFNAPIRDLIDPMKVIQKKLKIDKYMKYSESIGTIKGK